MSKQSLIDTSGGRNHEQLMRLQALPLEQKVNLSLRRIRDFINKCGGDTYISFSGGKDSTVLLDLVRQVDPTVLAVFGDTGLEFPEIKDFIKSIDNVEWVKPKMTFKEVIETYGYPLVSKKIAYFVEQVKNTKSEKLRNIRLYGSDKGTFGKISEKWKFLIDADFDVSAKCCDIMKKRPLHKFTMDYKKANGTLIYPFVGTMATESVDRKISWIKSGCNTFDSKKPNSTPISFWTEDDIWDYIKSRNLPYSKIYDMGYKRTGCVFCGFGAHLEKGENRFQLLRKTHPELYDYCMESKGDYGLGMKGPLETIGVKIK